MTKPKTFPTARLRGNSSDTHAHLIPHPPTPTSQSTARRSARNHLVNHSLLRNLLSALRRLSCTSSASPPSLRIPETHPPRGDLRLLVAPVSCETIGAMLNPLLSWKDQPQTVFAKSNFSLPWRTVKLLVPHRLRRKLRSKLRNRQSPASSITTLQTSFSPADTLRSLQSHRWSLYDGQYLLLAILGIFSLCIIESPGTLVKTTVASLLLFSLVLPITRQFFLPFLPIAAWLIFFYACG